jgi:DNA-binding SARP family transcriptional activator
MDYEYDAETFVKELSLAEKTTEREQKEGHLLSALKVYKGPFLPDLDETWVIVERERLYQLFMETLLRLAGMYVEDRNYEASLTYCQRALDDDRCQEGAHRIAMRAYAEMGNRALVIRQYEQCRQALREEVDAQPSLQTRTLFEALIQ